MPNEPNGERQLGHWLLTNVAVVWVIVGSLVGAGITWGATQSTNAADHRLYTVRLEKCEVREQRLEDRELAVMESLARIEERLGIRFQKR